MPVDVIHLVSPPAPPGASPSRSSHGVDEPVQVRVVDGELGVVLVEHPGGGALNRHGAGGEAAGLAVRGTDNLGREKMDMEIATMENDIQLEQQQQRQQNGKTKLQ